MLCLETPGFRDTGNISLCGLCFVAGPAEDLKVFGGICPAEGKRQNMINVPGFTGVDLLGAG